MSRSISRIDTTPAAAPGFIGEGHLAVEVVQPIALAESDPFVLLMDDRLDIPNRRQIGGAHPHAGLETVTLVLEGTLHDRDEGPLAAGDALWMTAGRGGWLAPAPSRDVAITAGDQGVRLVLYAGPPIGEPLVQHGPFVAGSRPEIAELYRRFRAGQFTSMSQLAERQHV